MSRHSAVAGTAMWIGWQLLTESFVPAVLLALSPLVLVPLLLSAVFGDEDHSPRVRALCWTQLPCALPLVVGLSLAPGVLALLACVPWAGWTALAAVEALARVRALIRRSGLRGLLDAELAIAAGLGFPLIGSGWLLCDRLAIEPLGFSPLIVLLTAVHFHHAGLTLPLSAGLLARSQGSHAGLWRLTAVAVVVAVPMVAIGITASPIVELAGAWLTAAAAIAVALGLLARAGRVPMLPIIPALLSAGAGACLLGAMVFAASYALGEYRGVAWPNIVSMIQLHGAVNALGFGLLGAWSWALSPPKPA